MGAKSGKLARATRPGDEVGMARSERRLERRNQLLGAAIDEIRVVGPGATMEQLAKAGGVTKPILYRHFGDRDGLIDAIAERFGAELLISVTEPLLTAEQPREILDATIGSYVAFLEREPFLYGFLVEQPSGRSESRSPVGALVDVIARQIAIVTGERLAAAGRDTGPALPWAYGIVGLVHQSSHWWLREQTMSRERFVSYLTDLLWNGLANEAADEAGEAAAPGVARPS